MKILVACISSHSFDWTLGRGVELDGRRFVHRKLFFNADDPLHGPNRRVATVRETWAKTLKELRPDFDLRFFYGSPSSHQAMQPDEVLLNAPDDYRGLVSKVKGVFQYALKHDYDFVLKIDDDTFLIRDVIERIDANPELDYIGTTLGRLPSHKKFYACGGNYRLSKRAVQILDAERYTVSHFSSQAWTSLIRSHIRVKTRGSATISQSEASNLLPTQLTSAGLTILRSSTPR